MMQLHLHMRQLNIDSCTEIDGKSGIVQTYNKNNRENDRSNTRGRYRCLLRLPASDFAVARCRILVLC